MLRDDAIRAGRIEPTDEDIKRMGLKVPRKPETRDKKAAAGRNRRIKPDRN